MCKDKLKKLVKNKLAVKGKEKDKDSRKGFKYM